MRSPPCLESTAAGVREPPASPGRRGPPPAPIHACACVPCTVLGQSGGKRGFPAPPMAWGRCWAVVVGVLGRGGECSQPGHAWRQQRQRWLPALCSQLESA